MLRVGVRYGKSRYGQLFDEGEELEKWWGLGFPDCPKIGGGRGVG